MGLVIVVLSVFLKLARGNGTADSCENGVQERLWLGETSIIQYSLEFPDVEDSIPSYSIRYSTKPLPFVTDDTFDRHGFKRSDQSGRFSISSAITGASNKNQRLSVNLTISSVSHHDAGEYILIFTLYTPTATPQKSLCKKITVRSRPAKAKCYIPDKHTGSIRQLHCHANSGDSQTALSCFQDNQKLPRKGEVSRDSVSTTNRILDESL